MHFVKYVQFIVDSSQLPDQKKAKKRDFYVKTQITTSALLNNKQLNNNYLQTKIMQISSH